jgi:D-alanyl-D-alanine carboxypeptidase
MTRFRRFRDRGAFAVCALALAGGAGCAGEPDAALPHDTRVEAGLQQVLDQAMAAPGVFLPGAITYYHRQGYAPWSGSAGLRDLQAQLPMRPENRIRAGSIVKTFIATVTLQHVEEGTLSLDQTLPELLPSTVTDRFRAPPCSADVDRITLRMLLNHTSGIPEFTSPEFDASVAENPAHVWTNDELLGIAALQPARFAPGASWGYSNTNYTLLGMVLDRVGGMSWRWQIRLRLLLPLGLWSTELPEPGDRTVRSGDAHGYVDAGGTPLDLSYVDPSMAGAAGGNAMVSTVQDLARFLEALLAGRLFAHAQTLAEMTTMVDAPNEAPIPHRYGLGLESYEYGGTTLIGNAGGAAGYVTMMYRIAARDTTLVTAVTTGDMFVNALEVLFPSVEVIDAPAP